MGELKESFPSEADGVIKAKFTNPAIVIGKVFKVDNKPVEYDEESYEAPVLETDVDKENQKKIFRNAHTAVVRGIQEDIAFTKEHGLFEVKDVAEDNLEAEKAMLEGVKRNVEKLIDGGFSAEAAVYNTYKKYITRYEGSADPNFQKLGVEAKQHRNAIFRHIQDKPPITLKDMPNGSVLVTESLSLSDVMHFIEPETGKKRVEGIIVEEGSMHSHAMILAQAMGIPVARVSQKDHDSFGRTNQVVMDGSQNTIHLMPEPDLVEKYRGDHQASEKQRELLEEKWHGDRFSEMKDGGKFNVHANYGMSYEAHMIRDAGARGIGLYRTEMYMEARKSPISQTYEATSVERHLEILRNSMKICCQEQGDINYVPMTVRTIDIAGDKKGKMGDKKRASEEVRITRDQFRALALLKQELRALDEEHNPGDDKFARKLRVMIPNTRNQEHFLYYEKMMAEEAKAAGVPPVELGSMSENSAIRDHLPDMDVDFISIGSNDAYHFNFGIHRYGSESNALYDPTDKSFLKYIQDVAKIGEEKEVKVSLCGNMASEIHFLPLLIGCGLRDISAGAAQVDVLKELASRIDPLDAEVLVRQMSKMVTREERETALLDFNQKKLGLELDGTLDMERFNTKTPSQLAAMEAAEPGAAHPA